MPSVRCGELELFFTEIGPQDGRPVLFLPGLGGDGRSWRPIAGRLEPSWRRILVDPRDAGRSERSPGPYGVPEMAADVLRLCERLGLREADVVGYSLGGAIAQELAISRPQLVRRLVLVATYTSGDPRGTELFRGLARLRRRLEPAEYLRVLFPLVYSHEEYRIPGLVEEAIVRAANDPLWQEQEAYERQVEAAISFHSEGRLRAVRCPVLLIFGDEDLMTPLRFARRLKEELPHARLVVLSGAGHGLLFTRATEIAALVGEFLGSEDGPPGETKEGGT